MQKFRKNMKFMPMKIKDFTVRFRVEGKQIITELLTCPWHCTGFPGGGKMKRSLRCHLSLKKHCNHAMLSLDAP